VLPGILAPAGGLENARQIVVFMHHMLRNPVADAPGTFRTGERVSTKPRNALRHFILMSFYM
jgi:hypothetical protein